MLEIKTPNYVFGTPLQVNFAQTTRLVGVIMGSRSDWPSMEPCTRMLEALQIPFEFGVVSAHRTPERMTHYASRAQVRGLKIIIACAGGSAHLPGMIASETLLPVLGVSPKKTDSAAIGSMIEMPEGIPLAYLGGGSEPYRNAGAANAALLAARILALSDTDLAERIETHRQQLERDVPLTCF